MTILSKGDLVANINADLADNSTQDISPRDVRQNLLDLIDSVNNLTAGRDLTGSNFATPDTRTTLGGQNALGKINLDTYTSVDNSAFGYSAIGNNYIGSGNTALGSYSNSCNLYGDGNVSAGYASLGINVYGNKNVAVGNYALHGTRDGDYNIAIGHGAGYYIGNNDHYKLYIGAHNVSGQAACDLELYGSGVPLIFGELDTLRMGVSVNSLHDYGVLQVSGDISPNLTEMHHLGHPTYKWKSINQKIHFSGDYIGINTVSPSGSQGLVTAKGNIVPEISDIYSIGSHDLKWDGYFNDITVSGIAKINNYTYNEISTCTYECRTIYLAASGMCEGEPGVCGYMTDEEVEGGGFVLRASGTDYRRDYEFLYKAPDSTINCVESETSYARSSWNSNISIHIESGRHLMTDRVIGWYDTLSLVTNSGCNGFYIYNLQNDTDPTKSNRLVYGPNVVKNELSANANGLTDINFVSSGMNTFTSAVVSSTSGNSVSTMLKTRGVKNYGMGFQTSFTDTKDALVVSEVAGLSPDGTNTSYDSSTNTIAAHSQQTNRLEIESFHTDNTKFKAVTIMKNPVLTQDSGRNNSNYNRWQINPEGGLVGVSNFSSEKLPNSIFNVQSTGDFSIKATAPDGFRPRLELLSGPNNTNEWLSSGVATDDVSDGAAYGGLVMEYLPSGGRRDFWSSGNPNEPASVQIKHRRYGIIGLVTGDNDGIYNDGSSDYGYGASNEPGTAGGYFPYPNNADDSIYQNAASRYPNPDYIYRSFITFNESGVGVNVRDAHSALTLSGVFKGGNVRGGVLSMAVQPEGTSPTLAHHLGREGFGELVASGFNIADTHSFGQASTIWYCDASGNNFELINNPLNPKNAASFVTNASGNTFLGYSSPQERATWITNGHMRHNTGYGFEALTWGQYTQFSTALGSQSLLNIGSGISTGSGAVGVGYRAGANMVNAVNSIAIGNNCEAHDSSSSITIGPNITSGNYVPHSHMLLIGAGDDNIILKGKMGPNESDKELTVSKGKLTVSSTNQEKDSITIKHDQNFFGTDKAASVFQKKDLLSVYPDGGVAFTFTGSNGHESTLVSMMHDVAPLSKSSSFANVNTPVMGVSGDLNVLGQLNFADGTAMSSASGLNISPGSGLSSRLESGKDFFDLDIEELELGSTLNDLSPNDSFLAISTSTKVGKINISELSSFIEVSGGTKLMANCNHVFAKNSSVDPTINKYSNWFGCYAGHGVVESNYSNFIGPEAGSYSTSAISGAYSSNFIGHRAGYDADNSDNSVFLGTNAGNGAVDSRMSTFIGHSAGHDAKSSYSIAIGNNALETSSGSYNLEIITKQTQSLLGGYHTNKFNIMKTITGDTITSKVSVGDAIIHPSAVLAVNYSNVTHSGDPHIQEWYVDSHRAAAVNIYGAFDNVVEGTLLGTLFPAAAAASPTSGEIQLYGSGWQSTGASVWIHNRDTTGSGNVGAYVMAIKINDEYRPIWVGCQ